MYSELEGSLFSVQAPLWTWAGLGAQTFYEAPDDIHIESKTNKKLTHTVNSGCLDVNGWTLALG